MTPFSAESSPRIFVYAEDDATRNRAERFFHSVGERIAATVLQAGETPEWNDPTAVFLLLSDRPAVVEEGAYVYPLPRNCSDDALLTAATLLMEVARLRRHLSAARHREGVFQQLAAIDPLTELANRRTWDEALRRECREAAADELNLTVAILDLDQFKQLNDRDGHAVGDAALKATADGLRRAIRRGDLAARIGGDEFGLLLPGLGGDAAATVVERIRRAVVDAVAAAGPSTTCSVGFVTEQGSGVTAERLYAAADAALQIAKQSGRNQISQGAVGN